jgi:hypothetical protein
VLVHAHVGAVHEFHDLAHGAAGHDPVACARSPGSLAGTRLANGISPFDLDVGALQFFVEIGGDLLDAAAFGFDTDFLGHAFQL